MPEMIGLDFETYGATDLPSRGLHNYASCSTFQPLIAGISEHRPYQDVYVNRSLELYSGNMSAVRHLEEAIDNKLIVAHNAGFEQRTLAALGIDVPSDRFIDSAVIARAMGAAGKLEAAAPQLLGVDKMAEGKDLIRLFSIPGKYQEAADCLAFDPAVIEHNADDWRLFKQYCELDAELGLRIAVTYLKNNPSLPPTEMPNQAVTMDMNLTGWHVDVATVEEMQRRYLENQEVALAEFRAKHNAHDLNLASLKQLKEWCEVRGIKATSFDEKHVAKLIERIEKRLDDSTKLIAGGQHQNYTEVLDLLRTKQILGGSSLKKLVTILNLTGKDCRLRDQYLHVGAGQSYRTTGKGVQMQNLKRLDGDNIADMLELQDLDTEWDNEKLAKNLRQCFTASHPQGQLVVGDFSSVESRGLAWLADERWKLDAYRQGKDLYKVQAAQMYGVTYDQVTKPQRQTGKVGELSCGYQAGAGAVQAFAENMGVAFSEGEAMKLVTDWRMANPLIVDLWRRLDEALHEALESNSLAVVRVGPAQAYKIRVYRSTTPESLLKQHPGAESLAVEFVQRSGNVKFRRYFHGCYLRGNSICYYKPSELKSGDLWRSHFTDPKTKQVRFHSIYGGKLSGIVTQSLCREMFFDSLRDVHSWVKGPGNVDLVGQFHDEIVLDWRPDPHGLLLDETMGGLRRWMTHTDLQEFPLAAEIKHDYRYTK